MDSASTARKNLAAISPMGSQSRFLVSTASPDQPFSPSFEDDDNLGLASLDPELELHELALKAGEFALVVPARQSLLAGCLLSHRLGHGSPFRCRADRDDTTDSAKPRVVLRPSEDYCTPDKRSDRWRLLRRS